MSQQSFLSNLEKETEKKIKMEVLSPRRVIAGLPMIAVYPLDVADAKRIIVASVPIADWRLLTVAFLFPELFKVKSSSKPNEKRIIFSTDRYEIEITKNSILKFLIDPNHPHHH